MVWWGAQDVARAGGVTLGALVAFPIYINMLFRPIRVLADKFNTLQMGLVASRARVPGGRSRRPDRKYRYPATRHSGGGSGVQKRLVRLHRHRMDPEGPQLPA